MRRVLYICVHGRPGGAELYLASLMEVLDRRRIQPLVVVGSDGPLVERLRGSQVKVIVLPTLRYLLRGARNPITLARNAAAFASAILSLVKLVHQERVDLIHASGEPAVKYGALLRLLTAVPVVCTLHEALLPPFGRIHRRLLVAVLRRLSNTVLVPSDANRALLVKAAVPETKVMVLHTGVDVSRFERIVEAGEALRKRHGIQPDQPLIAMLGRFDPLKGHDVLLRAMPMILERCPPARCLIVGGALFEKERAWEQAVHALAAELRLEPHVQFVEWTNQVESYFAAIDVLAHPSVGHDSLPTVVLEAMAAGRPVVASTVGGLAELIEDHVTGLLVTAGDSRGLAEALLTLIDRIDVRRRMGATARERAARLFGWPTHVDALLNVYEGAIGTRPGPPPPDVA